MIASGVLVQLGVCAGLASLTACGSRALGERGASARLLVALDDGELLADLNSLR